MKKKKDKQKLKDILHVAQLAAMEAGEHALRQFTRVHVLKEKPMSTDEVTSVDVENEKRIIRVLRNNFPNHTILTEERKLPRTKKQYIWWIDPLDGSISYFFRLPYWGISIALIKGNQPLIGVLYFPQTRDLYWAIKGEGAFRNYRKISVSKTKLLEDGVIGIDYGYRGERKKGVTDVTYKIADKVKYVVTYACTTAAIVLVAEGKLAGYIHHMARRFDLAAASLLLTEAGGEISDSQGNAIDWRDKEPVNFLSSNGKIHRQIIEALKSH